jgi:CDP-2,3-bis-(O-geranylgeranyl)-sn-glycerol synthase
MQGSLLLQLLILLVVANGTAVVAKKLLGATLARPLDGGALFGDGQPIFGPSKTIRGIVVSLLATSICAAAMGLGWEVGILVATFAMAGDLFSSFVKRRLHLPSSSMAIGLDHIPESLFPLLASRWLLPLNISTLWSGDDLRCGRADPVASPFQVESSRRAPLTDDRQLERWR